MRVPGAAFRDPKLKFFGFSPLAIFRPPSTPLPSTRMASMVPPRIFTYTVWPPIALPEPGMMFAVVKPPDSAMRMPGSSGETASRARSAGWMGPEPSLPSLLALTPGLLNRPRCEWVSTKPGISVRPVRSRISAPFGIASPEGCPRVNVNRRCPGSLPSPRACEFSGNTA